MYAGRTLAPALIVAGALAMIACDGPTHGPRDAGDGLGDATTGTGVAIVRLGEREEELPGEWQLEEAYVSLGEVRVDNDRGGDLEPSWESPGRVRIDEEHAEQALDAAPATYGGLTLRAGASQLAFELAFREGEHDVRVRSERAASELALRCMEGAVSVRPGDVIVLEATVDVAPIATRLATELPEASVEIDEESDPALLGELEAIFDAAWRLHCEIDR